MGRPPLALGTWGEIRTYPTQTDDKGKPIRYRAVTNYRDYDGRTRRVERAGKTKAAARNNLATALKERTSIGNDHELSMTSRFGVAAQLWHEKLETLVKEGQRSPGSLETYHRQLTRNVLPALEHLRLGEVTTPIVDKVITKMRAQTGSATARTCRSIISGVMGLAVRYGAVPTNPVRELERIEGIPAKEPRALTEAERIAWLNQLRADKKAVERDLPDLTSFMLATGVRIGEALAVLWSEFDLTAGSVKITSTIIRITGVGLLRKPTKSRAGQRTLLLPTWAVAMLRRRFMANPRLDQPIFPDSRGGFRDPSNTRRDIREARSGEFEWVVSHNFRKTTATIIDDADLSARIAADQLGHARPSMTQDVYFGRKIVEGRAAAALENVFGIDGEEKCG